MNNSPIIFIFNASLTSGCDYVMQTLKQITPRFPVYGLALGDIVSIYKWLTLKDRWIVRRVNKALILRPVSLLPGVGSRHIRIATYSFFAMFLRLYVRYKYRGRKKIVWFFEPFHMPPLLRIFQGYVLLYDCVDYYPGFSEIAKKEHEISMRKADLVFANSVPLARELKKTRRDTVAVPLGFAPELFISSRVSLLLPHKKPFTVGFIGGISDRVDFTLLYEVIRKLPAMKFKFVGPLEENVFGAMDTAANSLKTLLRFSNVTWVPGIPKRNIPSVLRKMDVGIIPYRDDLTFNRYSFPMKVLEYFSFGRPVIATDIASLRRYESLGLLTIAHTADEFVSAIRSFHINGWSYANQQRQRRHAQAHSWKKKIAAIISVIQ